MKKFIRLDKSDNVVIAVSHFQKDEILEMEEEKIKILNEIPVGHKIAVRSILQRESIIKYGITVGLALVDILPGEHVYIHNTTAE